MDNVSNLDFFNIHVYIQAMLIVIVSSSQQMLMNVLERAQATTVIKMPSVQTLLVTLSAIVKKALEEMVSGTVMVCAD